MKRCKTCKGRFEPILPDGLRYYHACPPLTMVTVERGGAEVEVDLIDIRPTDLIFVERAGAVIKIAPTAMLPGDRRVKQRDGDRSNRRDENVRVVRVDDNGTAITEPKREGAGVEDAP